MKVLFVYTDVGSAVGFSAGIGVLSAILKQAGHTTSLIHVSADLGYPLDLHRIKKDIDSYKPDALCFSITTNQWYFAREIGRSARNWCDIPIIVGGHHAMSDPEKVIQEPWIDILCRGEGDKALPEIINRIGQNRSMDGIANIYHKRDGVVIREPLLDWTENLDDLPFDDREVFDYEKIIESRNGWAEVIVTRGCPYTCTYCFNKPLLEQYKKAALNGGSEIFKANEFINRRRSVDSSIAMLMELKQTYPNIERFTFVDDVMAKDGPWFNEFSKRYAREIGLPFACTSQPLLFNRNVAQMLKDSGCKVVKMGVEAGNEDIRKKVLKRKISNKHLEEVFGIAREYNLKPQAFNMIGIPGETFENMMETVALNARLKPYIVWLSTFNPYPGTELYQECIRKNMIDESKWEHVDSYRGGSVLRDEFLPTIELTKLRILFRWLLNVRLDNGCREIFQEQLKEFDALPDEMWLDGTAEEKFKERDEQIDIFLREKDISHYVRKKYINMFWGKEYEYDLT